MNRNPRIKTTRISLLVLLFIISKTSFAQFIQYDQLVKTGMEQFGYIQYDRKIENRMYACIADQDPRVLISEDNGDTWRMLYEHPAGTTCYIKMGNFKISKDNKKLQFCFGNSNSTDAALIGIQSLDIETKAIKNYPVPNPEDMPAIESYDVYGENDDYAIIHTSYFDFDTWLSKTKVFYTKNGGISWDMIYYSDDNDFVHINNVAISPDNPEKLFLCRTHSPGDIIGGLLISEDGGKSFKEHLAGITLNPITFHPDNADDITIGSWIPFEEHMEGVFRSTDGGSTWNLVHLPEFIDQTLNHITGIKYYPGEPHKMLITEENEAFYTENGGNTWERFPTSVTIGSMEFFVLGAEINPFNHNEIYMFESLHSDRITHTIDNGQNYSVITGRVPGSCSSISVGKEGSQDVLYYINPSNSRFYRHNLTANTQEYENSQGCDKIMTDATMAERAFLINTPEKKLYYKSPENTLYEIPGTAENVMKIARESYNLSVYWAAMNGSVYTLNISNPENIILTEKTTPDNGGSVSGIFFPSGTNNTVYISKGNKIYQSDNNGTSWYEKSTGPGSNIITDMAINPFNESEFIISTGDKLYYSTNAGASWTEVLSGYTIKKIAFSTQADGHIAAGIYDEESVSSTNIIYSVDKGITWKEVGNEQLRYSTGTDMDFMFGTDFIRVYISTSDMGRISYQFSTEGVNSCKPARSLMVKISDGNTAVLEWISPEDNKYAYYNVYRDGILIAYMISGTSYVDKDFPEGEHEWSVRVICEGSETEAVSRTATGTAFQPPRDLNVNMHNIIGEGNCGATLTWNTPNGVKDNTITYNIYRNGNLIQPAYAGRSFEDNDFEPGLNKWCIVAVYEEGQSIETCMEASCLLVCDSPRNISVKVSYEEGECKAMLSWLYPDGFENATYDIYRDGTLIESNINGLSYTDTGFECGEHTWNVKTMCGSESSEAAVIRSYCSACEQPFNFDIQPSVSDNGSYSAKISWNTSDEQTETKTIFHEGFEEGIPETWKNMDKDGDGHQWVANFTEPYIYDESFTRHNGEYVYSLREYMDPDDFIMYQLSPDNWLITPAIHLTTGDATLQFFAALVNSWWQGAYYEVYISTTGTDYKDFILLYSDILTIEEDAWYEKNIPLTGYTGNVYLAIRNLNDAGDRTMGIKIDEVSVIENPYTYTIYRNDMEIASNIKGTSFTDENLGEGEYEWCVKRICASGESVGECKRLMLTGIKEYKEDSIRIYPNPTTGKLLIENGNDIIQDIRVLDISGKTLQLFEKVDDSKKEINLSTFPNGVYFIKVNEKVSKVVKNDI